MSAPPHADPGRGVFETTLVLEGRPVELEAHLARIEASLAALYGASAPDELREAVLERARALRTGRLRFAVAPGAAGLETAIDAEEIDPGIVFPGAERAANLSAVIVAGGLGEHKWADRRLLDRAAGRRPGTLSLLLDVDGSVLEAARGSVFAVREGSLRTPPTDGRILLSIARRQAIEVATAAGVEVEETRLTRADLLTADEVFLAGSLRGIEPVGALDGRALPGPSELTRLVGDSLRRRWFQAAAAAPVAAAAAGRPGGPPGAEVAEPIVRPRRGSAGGSGGGRGRDQLRVRGGLRLRPQGDAPLRVERRDARLLGQLGGATSLLGGVERGGADGHHRRLGGARRRQRLLHTPLQLADQRRPGALRQQPVLRRLGRRGVHPLRLRRRRPNSSATPSGALYPAIEGIRRTGRLDRRERAFG